MTFTAKELSHVLQAELDKEYDVIRIARIAFQLYQDHGIELSPDINETLLKLMAMEEGPEFEYSEDDLKKLAEELGKG